MSFEVTDKAKAIRERLLAFMDAHVYPNENRFYEEVARERWKPALVIEELKKKARGEGLWNLFLLPEDSERGNGPGLTHEEYAPLCEIMGRSFIGPEVFNCSAPDTGNMEVLTRYGTAEQKKQWLDPLLEGKVRSCFAMTDPRSHPRMRPISKLVFDAMETPTLSTGENGGLPGPATRGARSRS